MCRTSIDSINLYGEIKSRERHISKSHEMFHDTYRSKRPVYARNQKISLMYCEKAFSYSSNRPLLLDNIKLRIVFNDFLSSPDLNRAMQENNRVAVSPVSFCTLFSVEIVLSFSPVTLSELFNCIFA